MATDTTNPKDLVGVTKPQLHLIPASALLHEAGAMENGAAKYGPFNWREKDVKASVYVSACFRHLLQWFDREDFAKDSGVHHLGHARACLGILLDAAENGCLLDDRPRAGAASEMVERLTKKKGGSKC